MIDFESVKNRILINPRYLQSESEDLIALAEASGLTDHFFVLTSGTSSVGTSGMKWVALSRSAVLASAAAVNEFLGSDRSDIWLRSLPEFHVGGLGIFARCYLSGATFREPQEAKWSVDAFVRAVHEVTLASLVPTQVHDLVEAGLRCPSGLRAILVGGGALRPSLFEKARDLGWPLIPSYGLSEVASTAAAARQSSTEFTLLSHVEARTDDAGRLQLRGPSLLTGYVTKDGFRDPKTEDGWLTTEDLASVNGATLTFLGRADQRLKTSGELINLAELQSRFDELAEVHGLANRVVILALPDARLENVIVAACEEGVDARPAVEAYNAAVLPFERVRRTEAIPSIPRTELGKVKWKELASTLSSR